MLSFSKIGFLLAFIPFLSFAQNQSTESLIQSRLTENVRVLGLQDSDIEDWVIYDEYVSKLSSVKHVYIRQRFEGIEIYNGVANFNIKDGKVLNAGYRLVTDVSGSVNTTMPTISQAEAINYAANHLGISQIGNIKELKKLDDHNFLFTGGELSVEEIPVKLMYMPMSDEEKSVRLVWDLSIYIKSQDHWWSMRIDAVTGEMLDKLDWVVECNFDNCTDGGHLHSSRREIASSSFPQFPAPAPAPATDAYRVFAIPTESPTHGPRTLVVGPSDVLASPFGWHDDNGVSGPEYLHTQGNNVRATEDLNGNNGVGFLPNGGDGLSFDFPLDLTQAPIVNVNAAITNLFYMNNIMHDVWYHYGFDEVSGNFQENNYGKGGSASDMVYAEAQDGGGSNNANFATPADGGNPRMQMYLWTTGVQYPLTINSPAGIAWQYQGISASFGPGLPAIPLTADLALVDDGTGDVLDACSPLINGSTVSGKIAVILRGTCAFTNKVQAAQDAGAVGVIVVNNVAGAPITMGGASATITIPSIMVSDLDGALIIAQLQAPVVVNGSIVDPGPAVDNDGDYDNGIIAHEYGHGISNRLTGGPSAANCLGNAEQMGEGWSDWFGLILTIEPGDLPTDVRGIGTYALGEPTNGGGIRPAPYSTDLAVNNYTYGATNNTGAISQPHGIGFVWCTMLWDLTWAMVNQHGYDTDLYNGTGGNNMAMALVIEGLKLQPCNPGFVDGRDAILAADQALYAGGNQCLIWEVFAARGLGFSADQGSSNSRTDQTEAYDLPLSCQSSACATTTTWDGTAWSNGAPNANSYAIINGAYSTGTNGDLTACVMQIDADMTIDTATDTSVSEILVTTGNTLTVDGTSSLTVTGNYTNNGTVILNSTADDFSSLIVSGTATGDITYNRFVNSYNDGLGGGWDLVGSPTVMTITDFTTANGANIQVLGDDYAFSQYDNAIGDWVRYQTASQTGSFTTAQGYSMATVEVSPPPPGAAGATVAFTGAMQTTDQSINIINNTGLNGVGRRWNLVSNPYPSYINGNTGAGASNFIDTNLAVIDGNYGAVYGWNGSSYDIYNLLDGAFSIAPGQGFWVAALNTTDTALNFTADMRTITGSGDFVTGPELLTHHVAVKLFNGETEKATTDFYFRDGLSLGLDPGYDAGAFNQSTKLSSRLAMGSQEVAFAKNAMGMDAMQNTRVPLEIRQNAGQAFRVSMADVDLPEDIYVYLEDTLNGTLTSLKDQDFELTAQSDLSGVDRFFIVFKSNSVLSSGDTLGIDALNVYKANTDSFVTIAGITPDLQQLEVRLFSMLGVAVKQAQLNTTTATQTISTEGLASGLYMVQIKSGNQTIVKKIIVK